MLHQRSAAAGVDHTYRARLSVTAMDVDQAFEEIDSTTIGPDWFYMTEKTWSIRPNWRTQAMRS